MTLAKKLERLSLMARIGGIAILIALLGIIGYQLYDFYSDKIGFTPTDAIESYLNALARGNYEEVYRLTYRADLTDVYGRPITQGEFHDQLRKLTGGQRLPFRRIEATKLFERQSVRYYEVKLSSSVGGIPGESKLLIQVRREGGGWVVSYPFAIIL